MTNAHNILIVGVGGQGTILASKIIGQVAVANGLEVKQSEVHGMAQRGGNVVTYVRYAPKVYSPLVEKGEADLVLAFEKLEGLRWADYLKPHGTMIINDQEIAPMPVIIGAMPYPKNIIDRLEQEDLSLHTVKALPLAIELGSPKVLNVLMLGVAAKLLDFPFNQWIEAVKACVPTKAIDINIAAFTKGWNVI